MSYRIQLTSEEKKELLDLIRYGSPSRRVTRARILLRADAGLTIEEIAGELELPPDLPVAVMSVNQSIRY